jgi:deoxyadenosine/deoxycytidine kinase
MNNPSGRPPSQQQLLVGVVGVCAAGKSTLIKGLKAHGIQTRHIAQEHSYVMDMWKRITNPDVLVFLDASFPVTLERRQLNWCEADWAEEQKRLKHARANANLYINTDALGIEQVLQIVINFIDGIKENQE